MLLVHSGSWAQTDAVSVAYMQGKAPVAPDAIAALGPDMFGDKINLFNGSFSFEQTDVELPGNNALPVALVRTHSPGRSLQVRGSMADWDVSAPRIEGIFPAAEGWVPLGGSPANRCSGFEQPPAVARGGRQDPDSGLLIPATDFQPWEYGQGVNLVIPGQGSQEILKRASGYALKPGDSNSYPLVTSKNWQIGCLQIPLLNSAGQGFFAISPEGVRYVFNWMASRQQTSLMKSGAMLIRRDFYLMATQVTDRFGNVVTYSYDSANPLNLTRIESTDGRQITLTYSNGRVTSVYDGTRTWQYLYSTQGDLQFVQQPDNSRWKFDLSPMRPAYERFADEYVDCDSLATTQDGAGPGSITHPSGAVGTFTTAALSFGRTNVQRACTYIPGTTWTDGAMWAKSTANQALIGKTISGPGMATMTWRYEDDGINPWGEWAPCTVCRDHKTVTVTEPNGYKTRHTFGIFWRVNEGQLLKTEEGWDGASALRTTTYTYRDPATQSPPRDFPDRYGDSTYFWSDWLSTRNRPQDSRLISQQAINFSWTVDTAPGSFSVFAQPQKVITASSLGYSRTDLTAYDNNTALWVLGQVHQVNELTTGLEVERHEYDASKALRSTSFEFGLQKHSYAYNADGTLATLFDQANRPTTFQNFKRGKPQGAVFADQTSASIAVNNLGNIASATNEVGTTTGFSFDTMGRESMISYPAEPTFAYAPTTQTFEQVGFADKGFPAGHWRQTITTGPGVTLRWFDEAWRVRLQLRYDSGNSANTSSYVETRYDGAGRKVFESYPVRNISAVNDPGLKGKRMSYDALNRVVRQEADNDPNPVLVTTIEYLPGFLRRVTNPRLFVTTSSFHAVDAPSEDRVRHIWALEGVEIDIPRDTFGKPTTITRDGNAASATRSYGYDAYQRLCRTTEPESGTTLQAYDAAGNITWRASGLSASSCDPSGAPTARRVNFAYDARNRLTGTTYGDGSTPSSRTYTADGLPATINTPNFGWTMGYNNRRLQVSEQFNNWQGSNTFTYGINPNGHVSSLGYPAGGPTVQYLPDAFGNPTQVSSYLSGIWYHPNGGVGGYSTTASTPIAHTVTQNTRGLPEQVRDIGVVEDFYTYDENGNVVGIADQLQQQSSRIMTYDGLDRLKTANGSAWGNSLFNYDTLDNLTSSTVGSRAISHNINSVTNRLESLSGSLSLGFGYDLNGNVTQRGGQSFLFDIGNRLSIAYGVGSYTYDGLGRRSWTQMASGRTVMRAYSQAGRLLMTNDSVRGITWHIYLGDKVAAETNTQTGSRWLHTDALGSPVASTNGAGQVIDRTRYEPYGVTAAGVNPNGIGFTGHVNDPETGLVYMQQRFYDPIGGRFLSVDPVTTDANSGKSFNRYDYANNNPYGYTDPDGRSANCTGTRIASACPADGGIAFSSSGSSTHYASGAARETLINCRSQARRMHA